MTRKKEAESGNEDRKTSITHAHRHSATADHIALYRTANKPIQIAHFLLANPLKPTQSKNIRTERKPRQIRHLAQMLQQHRECSMETYREYVRCWCATCSTARCASTAAAAATSTTNDVTRMPSTVKNSPLWMTTVILIYVVS